MARVTSKLQVTIPKRVADQYRIRPGVDVVFEPAGDVIRVVPKRRRTRDPRERVRLFEQILARQEARQQRPGGVAGERDWTREELYGRGRAR